MFIHVFIFASFVSHPDCRLTSIDDLLQLLFAMLIIEEFPAVF
jgi:hypothetical protein